jgi:hypothetical protein
MGKIVALGFPEKADIVIGLVAFFTILGNFG